ncbi:MAG: YraN family protein [Melioribacter sp.]|nr:YraN family protein [Melioribacter sp.]
MKTEEKKNKRKTGSEGEEIACEFISKLGYKIVERNYQFGHGEIDIIAKDGEILVFIEVKYRKNLEYGPPELAITKGKQNLVKRTATAYLWEKEIKDELSRIDVIAILKLPGQKPQINHIINAF